MKKKHVALLVGILVLDQLSKILVDNVVKLNESLEMIPNFFYITYAHNSGAAWSMLEGKMLFFYVVAIGALIAMFLFYRNAKANDTLFKIGIVCMSAGTIGNFIDRLMFQYVRDFLDFIIFGYDFPIFNIADMALCIGVLLIVLDVVREYLQEIGVMK
ncbi:MAG: signal peptidase II [Erysipelotrichaceae bacterium]